MDIIIAAEKPSIAMLLSEYTHRHVDADDISVTENPDETGSFFIGWQLERFVLSPGGSIRSDDLELMD